MTYSIDGELLHYGVLGMKWGVRKDRRPNRSERRERRHKTKDLAAAQKNEKMRARMNEDARRATDSAEEDYRKTLAKTVLPWNLKKKERAIDESSERLSDRRTNEEETKWRLDRAKDIRLSKETDLKNYVDSLVKQYGSENVKSLNPTYLKAGKDYVQETFKTGIRTEKLPVIGNSLTSRKVSKWEREIRDEIADKRSKNKRQNRYA